MSEKEIPVEEETTEQNEEQSSWTEEFTVAGSELWAKVKELAHEATVRRVVIVHEAKNIHFEVPLMVGVAGIALLPVYAAVALIAALVGNFKIMVERFEKTPEAVAEA